MKSGLDAKPLFLQVDMLNCFSLTACGGDVNTCFKLEKTPTPHWKHLTNLTLLEPRLMGATATSSTGVVFFRYVFLLNI